MPKYSEKSINLMKSIVEASLEGKTFQLPSNKDAINMRQRIYNYRNAIRDQDYDDFQHYENVQSITVIVKGSIVMVAQKPPDYMDSIENQLE